MGFDYGMHYFQEVGIRHEGVWCEREGGSSSYREEGEGGGGGEEGEEVGF